MAAVGTLRPAADRSFLLQRVQPALTGLIDGSLSTLASICWRLLRIGFARSLASVALGGAIIAALGAAFGSAAG